MADPREPDERTNSAGSRFRGRVWTVLGAAILAIALVAILVIAHQILLFTFLGVLGALLLDSMTAPIRNRTRLPSGVALLFVILAIVGLTVGAGFLLGASISEQFGYLSKELPPAFAELQRQFHASTAGKWVAGNLPPADELVSPAKLFGTIGTWATGLFALIAGLFFALVVSIYLAATPKSYWWPLVQLVPAGHRNEFHHVLIATGHALKGWLLARLISMTVVGVLTGLGLWALGIPAPASLGIIAGVLSFVPNLGPILSSFPGILLGLAEGPDLALWAACVYVGVQLVESNFITPYTEHRVLALPAAFLIAFQLVLGAIAGIPGLLVATPIAVTVVVFVRELYVKRQNERMPDAAPTEPLE